MELLWWINRKNYERTKNRHKAIIRGRSSFGPQNFEVEPKDEEVYFGEKNSIHIIDLTQTVDFIKNALVQVHKVISVEVNCLWYPLKNKLQNR